MSHSESNGGVMRLRRRNLRILVLPPGRVDMTRSVDKPASRLRVYRPTHKPTS